MRSNFRWVMLSALTFAVASTAAVAGETTADKKDPNRMICEKQEVLGSRLQSRRVCMTAAEWDLKRREERQSIDRNQISKNGKNGG